MIFEGKLEEEETYQAIMDLAYYNLILDLKEVCVDLVSSN